MIRTQSRTASLYSQDDPLSLALKPPSFESDEERERRVKAELEAQLISDRIDEELRQERELKRRQNTPVKVSLSLSTCSCSIPSVLYRPHCSSYRCFTTPAFR